MPFKLTKEEALKFTGLQNNLRDAKDHIESAVSYFNVSVNTLRPPVEVAVTEYNEILSQIRAFTSQITSNAEDLISRKTELWQESEPGQAAQLWKESWQEIDLDDLDYQWPDELIIEIGQHSDDLDDLPHEAD